jgi:hypothetical protein
MTTDIKGSSQFSDLRYGHNRPLGIRPRNIERGFQAEFPKELGRRKIQHMSIINADREKWLLL